MTDRRFIHAVSVLLGSGASSAAIAQQSVAPTPAAPPQTAPASGPAADRLQDIIVTATRRAETLQRVPIAVSAYNAGTIEQLSARQVGDLANITPNLARTSGPTGGNDAFFFIRGVGQLDSNPANDPGVGVYVDGVYLGRLQGASLDTDDVARVEVLRGPQGTLFGRNTIGGAISITTADPSPEFGAQGRVTIGSRNRADGYAALDLPVGDDVGIRASFSSRNQDGFARNVYTGALFGGIQDINARLKLVFKPSDDYKLTIAGDYTQLRDGSPQTVLRAFNPNVGPIPNIQNLHLPFPVPAVGTTPLGVPFPPDLFADTSADPNKNFNSIRSKNWGENYGVSTTAEWRALPTVQVKTILAYRHTSQNANNDFDGTGYNFYDDNFLTSSDQYSGELQLSGDALGTRLTWLAGGYAYYEAIHHDNAVCLGGNLGNPFPGLPGGPTRGVGGCVQNNQRFYLEITNFAGFANATYRLTDKLSAVGGIRYTTEHKFQSFDFYLNNAAGVGSLFNIPALGYIPTLSPNNPNVGVPTAYARSWDEFTPKAGLNYQADRDLLIYASYARGFKSGGFNGRPNAGANGSFQPIQAYNPETLDSFEVGLKSELFDRRLRFNLAGFYSIYSGIQLLVIDPASGFFNNENAGRSDIKGVEIETTARPVGNLELYVNAGYTADGYAHINPLAGIPLSAKLPVTPDWTLGAGGSYRFDLGAAGSLTPRADYSYRGSVFYGAQNGHYEQQGPVGLLNLRVTWSDRRERYSVSAFGLNVTDKRYYTSAQDVTSSLGVAFAEINPPGEWGLELGLKF